MCAAVHRTARAERHVCRSEWPNGRRARPAPTLCPPHAHTRARTHARKHTLTCTATHTWAAAVADGLRAAQPLAEQAAKDEDKLNLFVTSVVARAKELRLRVGAPTYAAAGHYLKVARSAPCFVRLLAATGPASCHGRCSHCSVMIGI